jgi:hypothetical protein
MTRIDAAAFIVIVAFMVAMAMIVSRDAVLGHTVPDVGTP